MESSANASGTVLSADGTRIAWSRQGSGPPLVVVDPLTEDRSSPSTQALAALLAENHTVYTYDRRGLGESGLGEEYSAESDVDDLLAVVQVAGGSADLYGFASGAFLALRAAEESAVITRVVALEPSLAVDDGEDELLVAQTELEGLGGVQVPVLVLVGSASGEETRDLAQQAVDALDEGEFQLLEADSGMVPDAELAAAIDSFLL